MVFWFCVPRAEARGYPLPRPSDRGEIYFGKTRIEMLQHIIFL